jgi:hypothetical protein
MVVDRVDSAEFWLRPIRQVTIVKGNPEKERRKASSDTDDS